MEAFEKNVDFCLLIQKTEKLLNDFFNKQLHEKGIDIKSEHWMILKSLELNSKLTQQEIADKHNKDKTYITRAVDFLETKNWVKRLSCKTDRRNKFVKLTQEGKAFILQNETLINKFIINEIYSVVSEKEMMQLYSSLNIFYLKLLNRITGK